MEQLIRTHIETYVPENSYTKLEIQCRTTFCELKMEGRDAESLDLVDKIAQEIAYQAWSDMVPWSHGGGSDSRSWHTHHEWRRISDEAERRFLLGPHQR